MIFPLVKEINQTGSFSFLTEIKVCLSSCEGFSPERAQAVFGSLSPEGELILSCKKEASFFSENKEAYRLFLEEKNDCLFVSVGAGDEKGYMRALFTLKRMLIKNEFPLGEIKDWPSFSVRGYIEGFYGKPWKSEERLEMMETMALFGENTHYYAPKDDPYHRNKWRELYPEGLSQGLERLVRKADSLCMDFYYCIAPGLSMKYSSEEDFDALCSKTKQLYSMGIKNFGLLLDDIPPSLFYEEDKKAFGDAVNAHTVLVNRYYGFLKDLCKAARLTVCPTAYHGKGNERELVDFASRVPCDVCVFYTGSDICSKELTVREAEIFTKNTLHKPLYWDNYPVNDAEMFMEMHTGPLMGRDGELYKYSEGIISNCMEYFNCNKIPLITIASYLWEPEKYDSEKAYDEALSFVFDEAEKEDFIILGDHFRTSCLHDENSRIMGCYLSAASVCFQTGDLQGALLILEDYIGKVAVVREHLKKRKDGIYQELERWIKKFILMSEILDLSIKVLKGEEKKDVLEAMMEEYNESATVLTSFCFREYIESVHYGED